MTTPAFFASHRVSRRSSKRGARHSLGILFALFATGCGSTQELVNQQQKALTSLEATVAAICDGWLDGNLSTTYARTALEAAGTLLEKERAKIGGSPDALANPALASVSESERQLARQIALLRKALADSDATTVRQLMPVARERQSQLP
ncbi:MAG: hypothetical protein ACJ731_07695 [Vicinamibacterales bacterium]